MSNCSCPHCNETLEIFESDIGSEVTCPACGEVTFVEVEASPSLPNPAEEIQEDMSGEGIKRCECPGCKSNYDISESALGQWISCSKCGNSFLALEKRKRVIEESSGGSPNGKGEGSPHKGIFTTVVRVLVVGVLLVGLLFVVSSMPVFSTFILAWVVATTGLLLAKQSGIISFGGGLIGAALVLMAAVEIFPSLGSDSRGNTTARTTPNSTLDEEDAGASGISLSLVKRKSLYRQAILLERQARLRAEITFPMPDVNSEEYREPWAALSILTKQNEVQDRIKKELWRNLVDEYGITEDSLIEIIVEGFNSGWPKP